ncbi:phosphopentomutase [Anaeromyxobacter diazotrophicus]|uniref:Phosphopentomutase n=1 Tax=Anaeromyxobacter diazotrophicus TaxID=2590199 RepID=A0A7I9VI49_9BACT|nr:phosphopentomutase [Anaeromyxobacter diazotrophicus]GEJ56074.1 phosphopentomutase [Anaeromyxobacter diazotrophicus]
MSDRRRFVILVADSAGCGALPDAAAYGDAGSDTLGHVSRAVGGLALPHLGRLGLGHLTPMLGVPPDPAPAGFYGKMAERSQGKDTITGHWEMMGIVLEEALRLFPRGFPPEILEPWLAETGAPGVLGNEVASGTEIIQRLGEEHQRTGRPIVYTSADSVFQVACHEETVPLETLYAWCLAARRQLDRWRVARVIARPFVGRPGAYTRTYHRRDFAIATPGVTVLERLAERGVPVVGVGKIPDIFDGKGITEAVHTAGNADGLRQTERLLGTLERGLLFVNLVDFDMLYGHRNDARGYAGALVELDRALPRLLERLRPGDVLAVTADHGCDPTTPSTDHSREYVPLLVHAPGRGGGPLGVRETFADLGATVAELFGAEARVGRSFLAALGG